MSDAIEHLVAAGRELIAEGPLTRVELGRRRHERWPEHDVWARAPSSLQRPRKNPFTIEPFSPLSRAESGALAAEAEGLLALGSAR